EGSRRANYPLPARGGNEHNEYGKSLFIRKIWIMDMLRQHHLTSLNRNHKLLQD
ncbi:hypothetical protein L9F63_027564, partial [Diploptera punctata]